MAQPGNLTALWAGPDNSRLTSKQYSFRLPVHVAAKIAALEEMYPQRSRTQIVGDLLSAALEGVEKSFEVVEGRWVMEHPETRKPVHEDAGEHTRYARLVDDHYLKLERELGNEDAKPLFGPNPRLVTGKEEASL